VTLPDTPSRTLVALAAAGGLLLWPVAVVAAGALHDAVTVSLPLAAACSAVPLVALVAGLRPHGWRASAWSAAAAAGIVAAAVLAGAEEEVRGGDGVYWWSLRPGAAWAAAVLLWAAAVAAWAEWRWRATRDV